MSEDWVIVYLSAKFTIVCIPVVAIWLFGSRIARWLITLMTLWAAAVFVINIEAFRWDRLFDINPADIWNIFGTKVACFMAVFLLFLPASKPWFRKKEHADVTVFT